MMAESIVQPFFLRWMRQGDRAHKDLTTIAKSMVGFQKKTREKGQGELKREDGC